MKSLLQCPFAVVNSIVICVVLMAGIQASAIADEEATSKKNDKWAPFRRLVGIWKGTGRGPTGESVQRSEWKFVLGGKFLQCKSSSKARGNNHRDIGLISYDRGRRKFIYRTFHSEGYVNKYVAEISPDGSRIVFKSEAIENGPPGFKAMEIIEFKNGGLETTLKLASGNGPYRVCVTAKLKRDDTRGK